MLLHASRAFSRLAELIALQCHLSLETPSNAVAVTANIISLCLVIVNCLHLCGVPSTQLVCVIIIIYVCVNIRTIRKLNQMACVAMEVVQ